MPEHDGRDFTIHVDEDDTLVAILQYGGSLLEEAAQDLNAQFSVHGLWRVVVGPDDVAALASVSNAS